MKKIEIGDGRILFLSITPGYCCLHKTIEEGFVENGTLKKSYSFSMWDDYAFNCFCHDERPELSFSFDANHPLYFPLKHLLKDDSVLIIDDDGTCELEKKYLELSIENDIVFLKFKNYLDKNELKMDKFHVFIKNIGPDPRSKIDLNYKDTKKRLSIFFNEVIDILTEEYHQITLEEYDAKQKLKIK